MQDDGYLYSPKTVLPGKLHLFTNFFPGKKKRFEESILNRCKMKAQMKMIQPGTRSKNQAW